MLNLTQAWTMTIIILAFLWLIVIVATAEAEVWRDEFNGIELKDWKPLGQGIFTWEIQNGLLHVKQDKPSGFQFPIGALQLIAFPGPHKQFTITATNMKTSTAIGIALGKRFPDKPGAPFYYIFYTERIYDRRFLAEDGSGPFQEWVPTHPGTIWEETREQLKEMKLTFNAGRFQMFANGKLRADFEDFHFGAVSLPLSSVERGLSVLPTNRSARLITYCGSIECPNAYQLMQAFLRHGYRNVQFFPRGIRGWQALGYPLEKGN